MLNSRFHTEYCCQAASIHPWSPPTPSASFIMDFTDPSGRAMAGVQHAPLTGSSREELFQYPAL